MQANNAKQAAQQAAQQKKDWSALIITPSFLTGMCVTAGF